ncbi:MAG: apolipoprotein N-acyltransferase [Alistipes sp.]|nr:apolipoprotein N-acyltransferase [Alistipes sp.]
MKHNSTKHRILLVLLSVALLASGWLGVTGFTLLVALIPLLIISENLSDSKRDFWRMFGWATLTFMLWSASTVWWVWNATPLGPLAAGLVGTFYNLCGFMLYHYTSKRAPRALAYTILVTVWIATEWAYNSADVMTFPWLLLGHGFSGDSWAVQWYEYTGIFGGTLWVLASNIAIFEVLRTRTTTAKVRAGAIALLPILISVVLLLTYKPSERTTEISVIQPNVPCYKDEREASGKMNPTGDIIRLISQVPASSSFMLLPESALAYIPDVGSIDEAQVFFVEPMLDNMIRSNTPTKLITGASTTVRYGNTQATSTAHYYKGYGWYDRYNSALLVDNDGTVNDIYHKGKLVIGVEAVPMRKFFNYLEIDLGGITGQLGWGNEHKLFENNDVKIGPSICYEGLYGGYFSGFARNGAEVMALISNDGWWGNTTGHKRLFDFCRLRAIETRRAIARSANTGISGFISPTGSVIGDRLEWDEEGVLTAEVELRSDKTIYTIYGDWIARISTFVAVLTMLYYVAYRIRKRNHLVD